MKSIFLFLLLFLVYDAKTQQSEIQQLQRNQLKTYKSDGANKSKGLKFHISYPSTYSLGNVNHPSIIKTFSSPTNTLFYFIGVVKTKEGYSQQDKKHILSKENMEITITSSNENLNFLLYKNGFKTYNC